MADHNQPFTAYATKANRRSHAAWWGWIVAAVLAIALVGTLLRWASTVGKMRGLESLPGKLDDANARLLAARTENQTNQDLIARLQSKITALQQEQAASAQMSKGLENEMRADLESKDVTISNLQGQLTVTILDQVLFDSGEANLKPDGQAVMRKVAAFLAQHPDLQILVIGYTDNMPIRPEARNRFASNWELSTARALAAVHFLTEQAGVDPRRVGAAGYGQYRPVADNATAAGRARNRRIAIAVLPYHAAGTNSAPTIEPILSSNATNSPPLPTGTNMSPPLGQ